MNKDAIILKDVSREYGGKTVLGPVSFSIDKGEIVTLVGTNGAGKTTLLEIMCGERRCSSGTISLFGKTPRSAEIAFLPQKLELFDKLSVEENIRHFSSISDSGDVNALMESLSLTEIAGIRYGSLSGGQKQRVNVACIMCGNPTIILMDEPNTGMDPSIRADMWEIIHDLSDRGITIILSSHFLNEAKRHSDRIIFLDKGRIKYDGEPNGLSTTRITVSLDANDLSDIKGYDVTTIAGKHHIVMESMFEFKQLLDELEKHGIPLDRVDVTVEDCLKVSE